MNIGKIKQMIQMCLEDRCLCRTYFKYHSDYWYLIPLLTSDKLFLSAQEDDFLIDGYTIRRFRDIDRAELKNDLCCQILLKENITSAISTPKVDISNWETVFNGLFILNENVIIEKESSIVSENEFFIGRIEKVFKHFAYVRHFDADGIWQDEPNKVLYNQITSLTFDSRYIKYFSKYVNDSYSGF